jgi:hypothetical protein
VFVPSTTEQLLAASVDECVSEIALAIGLALGEEDPTVKVSVSEGLRVLMSSNKQLETELRARLAKTHPHAVLDL